jgi:hypothetical protein
MHSSSYRVPSLFRPTGGLIRGAGLVHAVVIVFGLAAGLSPGRALALQPVHDAGNPSAGTPQVGLTFEYSKSMVNFGRVALGGVATRQVTIANDGPGLLTLTSYQVSGNGFSVSGLRLPVRLGSSQSLSFTAAFAPNLTGTFIGRVILEGTGSQKYTTSLCGVGDASSLSLLFNPARLDFGNVMVGGDAQLPILVQNRGAESITIFGASVTGTAYTISNPSLPVTLNAGQATSFTVTFAPTGSGASNGTALLTSSSGSWPQTVSLTGTGLTRTDHFVRLTWTDSTSPGIVAYDIYRGTVSGGPYSKLGTVSGTSSSYIDNRVAAGQTYYYVATAVTGTGQSGYSNEASANVP